MKWILIVIVGIVIIVSLFSWWKMPNELSPIGQSSTLSQRGTPTPTLMQRMSKKKTILFVPHWTVKKDDVLETYDQVVYFGISGDAEGIDTTNSAYTMMPLFLERTKGKEKLLAVSLINSPYNSRLLEDKPLQQKIIKDAVRIAKENDFDGLVLDFELSAVAFPSVVAKTTDFYRPFSKEVKQQQISFAVTLFGDTFYRFRAYDVQAIAELADEVMVMTYDMHKTAGSPGPNFPLQGKNTYGYDVETMLADFLTQVPRNKLTLIFGYFGHDWNIDETEAIAATLSTNQITAKFLEDCPYDECTVQRDQVSSEVKIVYRDEEKKKHNVWLDDTSSIERKQRFLEEKEVHSVGYWAHSFF